MASRTLPPNKSASQPKTQTTDQWHEDRYGEHRDQLSTEQLKDLVEEICGKNYDEQAAAGLVLLMDEIERAQFDRVSIQTIATTISNAAFRYTNAHETAERRLVAVMRKEVARKEVVN